MTVLGDTQHKIFYGDAIQVLQSKIPDASVDLIFADPPYNIGKNFNGHKDSWETESSYLNWCYEWLELCLNKLKPNGSFYVI
jgi:site-specific DNA-methyltransferase (adenine-specific)